MNMQSFGHIINICYAANKNTILKNKRHAIYISIPFLYSIIYLPVILKVFFFSSIFKDSSFMCFSIGILAVL